MRYLKRAVAIAFAGCVGAAQSHDVEDWPTHHAFADGTDLGLVMVYRYDVNDFSDDRLPDGTSRFDDSATAPTTWPFAISLSPS